MLTMLTSVILNWFSRLPYSMYYYLLFVFIYLWKQLLNRVDSDLGKLLFILH